MRISKVLLLIATLSTTVVLHAQTFSWKQKSSLPGVGRWGAYKFVIGNFGFIGGGYNNASLNDLWQYNPATDTWTQKSNCPMATRTAGSFSIAGYGYVVGGIVSPGSNITNSMYQYNPSNNTWLQKASYPGIPIYAAASFSISGKGYYGVGNAGVATGPYYNDFYEYDPVNDSWTQKAAFPGTPRYGVHGTATTNFGYVGFGSNESMGVFFKDWYQYHPITNTWIQKQDYPISLSNPSSFFINNKLYLGTGHSYSTAYSDMYSYDETADTWMPEQGYIAGGRWCTVGFAINNIGYIGTGTDNTNVNTYTEFYEFSPDSIICVTLKPDSIRGMDTHVLSGLPNTNVEPHAEFLACAWTCQGNPCNNRALIQFDLSVIPANATLVNASLSLYANPSPVTIPTANYGTNNAFVIQRITSAWNENTITWNTQPATSAQNEVIIPQSTSPGQDYLNIDVTPMVYDMLNNPQNSFGFMLRLVNEIPYNGRDFASSDNADSTKWPSITYCFVVPTGIKNTEVVSSGLKVYPTVFNNFINVEYKSVSEKMSVEILDITGKRLLNKTITCKPYINQTLELNEKDLQQLNANGVYFIRVLRAGSIETKRLIRNKY